MRRAGQRSRRQELETTPIDDIHQFAFLEVDVRLNGETAEVLSDDRQDVSVI